MRRKHGRRSRDTNHNGSGDMTLPGCCIQCAARWTAVYRPAAAQEDGVGEQLPYLGPGLMNRDNKSYLRKPKRE